MRRLTITGVVALFVLGVPMSASASTGTPGPSCATLARGATVIRLTPYARIFAREVSSGDFYVYGCAYVQPHTRFLFDAGSRTASGHPPKFEDMPIAQAGRYAASSWRNATVSYTTITLTDLITARKWFVRYLPSTWSPGSGAVSELAVNATGRLCWAFHEFGDGRTGGESSQVLVRDRRGTLTVSPLYPNMPVSDLSIGLRSCAWQPNGQPLARVLLF